MFSRKIKLQKVIIKANKVRTQAALFALVLCCACAQPKQELTTGEYTNGLHLSSNTQGDGIAYAWFDSKIYTDTPFIFCITPYIPKGNVVAWLPPNYRRMVYGEVELLGKDSFRIQLDKAVVSTAFAQQFTKPNSMTFVLRNAAPDWFWLGLFNAKDSTFIYKKANLDALRYVISPTAHCYAKAIKGEWVTISTDSGYYYVPRKDLY